MEVGGASQLSEVLITEIVLRTRDDLDDPDGMMNRMTQRTGPEIHIFKRTGCDELFFVHRTLVRHEYTCL